MKGHQLLQDNRAPDLPAEGLTCWARASCPAARGQHTKRLCRSKDTFQHRTLTGPWGRGFGNVHDTTTGPQPQMQVAELHGQGPCLVLCSSPSPPQRPAGRWAPRVWTHWGLLCQLSGLSLESTSSPDSSEDPTQPSQPISSVTAFHPPVDQGGLSGPSGIWASPASVLLGPVHSCALCTGPPGLSSKPWRTGTALFSYLYLQRLSALCGKWRPRGHSAAQ